MDSVCLCAKNEDYILIFRLYSLEVDVWLLGLVKYGVGVRGGP